MPDTGRTGVEFVIDGDVVARVDFNPGDVKP